MASDVELISQRTLLNQPVLDRDTLKEIGHVDVLWVYPPAHRVYGFICKTGLLGRTKLAFKLPQIEAIGKDGVRVVGSPEPTTADKVRQLPSLINAEVWSEGGDRLGKIVDYRFDRQTGMIAHYLFVADDWMGIGGDLYRLPPRKISSLEDNRVQVPDVSVPKLKIDHEGFQHIFEDAGDILQETYSEVQRELRGLTRRTRRLTEQAKEKLETLTEQAKEKAVVVTEHLRDEAGTLAEQAKETSQTVSERVKQRTQSLTEQAIEVSQTVAERLKPHEEDDSSGEGTVDDIAEPLRDDAPESPPTFNSTPDLSDDEWDLDDDEWDLDEPKEMPNPTAEPLADGSPEASSPSDGAPSLIDDEEWDLDDDEWHGAQPSSQSNPASPQPDGAAKPLTEEDDEPWV